MAEEHLHVLWQVWSVEIENPQLSQLVHGVSLFATPYFKLLIKGLS